MRFPRAEMKAAEDIPATCTQLTSHAWLCTLKCEGVKPTANIGPPLWVSTSTAVTHTTPPPNPDSCKYCFFPSAPTRSISRTHSFAKTDASTAGARCQYTAPVCLQLQKVITQVTCLATCSHTPLQHESRKNPADRSKDTIILKKEKRCIARSKIQSKGQSTHRADTANLPCIDPSTDCAMHSPQGTPPPRQNPKFITERPLKFFQETSYKQKPYSSRN